MNRFELKISPSAKMISIALQAAREYAGQYLSDPRAVSRLILALEEAIANVLHYSLTDSVQDITVTGEAQDGELKLSVLDKGLPGDYERILKDEDALGLTIMHASVDQVNIKNLGKGGRCQELIKYYISRPDFTKAEDTPAPKAVSADDIRILPLRKKDAMWVGRALYNEYGFSYNEDMAYYPERLYAASKKGDLYSLVAVNGEDRAVAHLAAWRWPDMPGIWESGMAVTAPAYRGLGLFNRLMDQLTDYMNTCADCTLHITMTLTTHLYSQLGAYRYGARVFGLSLSLHGAELLSSNLKSETDTCTERDSYVYMGWLLDRAPKSVYAVPEVKELLAGRYAELGAERSILTEPLQPEAEATVTDCYFDPSFKGGRICIFEIGVDVADRLRRDVLQAKRNGILMLELCIAMDSPGVAAAYEAARELGFFFTGVFAGTRKGDLMMLDLILSQSVNYERIHVIDSARGFLDAVRQLDPDQA